MLAGPIRTTSGRWKETAVPSKSDVLPHRHPRAVGQANVVVADEGENNRPVLTNSRLSVIDGPPTFQRMSTIHPARAGPLEIFKRSAESRRFRVAGRKSHPCGASRSARLQLRMRHRQQL